MRPAGRMAHTSAVRLPRSAVRIGTNVLLDGMLAAAALPLARWVADPAADALHPLWCAPAAAAALLLAAAPFRLPLQYWRFSGFGDLLSVAGASLLGAALFAGLRLAAPVPIADPAFPAIHALVTAALLCGPRIAYQRLAAQRRRAQHGEPEPPAALVVGSGEDADILLRALGRERNPPFRVAGLLSLGSGQTGRRMTGVSILGAADQAGDVIAQLSADGRAPKLLVIASDLGGDALASLLQIGERHGLPVRRASRPTLLSPAESNRGRKLELRDIAIEDLLNRPQVPLDREGMARLIQGARVVVTGAGGTIGSELARQLAALGPEHLFLIDNGEYALWQIDLELAETHPGVRRTARLADIRDEGRMRAVMADARPALVFHAAALKHVPMVEDNPLEGLATNVAGTRHVADAARAAGCRAMVLISTDKAVNPTSVMGASKRLAEMYCQALDVAARASGAGMRCVTVRFGNVLGSTGSVVPLFRRQLERGGPLTVTHPDMRRYFMTVREAVGLVLQASVLGTGDAALPDGGIFVLDMGEPVKIVDLARQMIRLAGLRPDDDVAISFTGLRPGEKLFEELFHGREPPAPTGHAGLLMATPRTSDAAFVGRAIEAVATACASGQSRLALAELARLVPEFEHAPNHAGTTASASRTQDRA